MTGALYDLARAVMALDGWAWRWGMAGWGTGYAEPVTIVDVAVGVPTAWEYRGALRGDGEGWWDDMVPDLTDPATAGALLALAGEGSAEVFAARVVDGWHVAIVSDVDTSALGVSRYSRGDGATLGEAVARAVLARGWWSR